MSPLIFSIDGNIGSGKSTIINHLINSNITIENCSRKTDDEGVFWTISFDEESESEDEDEESI